MDECKQLLFMERVLFIFDVTKIRAGKAQVIRMNSQQWHQEADIACIAGHIMNLMTNFRTEEDNLVVFPADTMAMVRKRFIEGDFHDELKPLVECQHPGFRANDTDLWRSNMADVCMKSSTLDAADSEISKLEKSKNDAQFQADQLALARDAAQCANLFQKSQQSERSARLARVMHLKQENSIGCGIVMEHMEKNWKHVGGPLTTLQPVLDEFINRMKKDKSSVLVWVDFMKFGRLSVADLNHTTELLQRVLSALPEQSCGFLIAPQLTSERRSSLRDEWRSSGAWEEKNGSDVLGDVRRYDPSPPPAEEVDAEKFTFKLATVTVDNNKKGWSRFNFSLSNEELQGLLDTYVVEARFSGRHPGTSLYLMVATRRQGESVAMIESQKFKLFLVAHQDIDIDCKEFMIGHGKSAWLKAEKVAKMERECAGGSDSKPVHPPQPQLPLRAKAASTIGSSHKQLDPEAQNTLKRQLSAALNNVVEEKKSQQKPRGRKPKEDNEKEERETAPPTKKKEETELAPKQKKNKRINEKEETELAPKKKNKNSDENEETELAPKKTKKTVTKNEQTKTVTQKPKDPSPNQEHPEDPEHLEVEEPTAAKQKKGAAQAKKEEPEEAPECEAAPEREEANMEEHGDLSQETLCLPGTGSDEECPGLAGGSSAVKSENGTPPDDGDDGHEPIGGNPAEPAKINKSETRNVSLHSVYWAVVHENQKFLKKKWENHPERLNAMSHMSKSELSRRRLTKKQSTA
ncbi:unnamed protein product [Durusdinium trenchii]|uniref:Uncharacterized protein n=1 Tax=Durusdinium trenchii TaxID=1381693 RepID=A0ABP0MPI9_9DINO